MTDRLNQNNILILGHGEMGKALSYLLMHHRPVIWERHSADTAKPIVLEDAVAEADIILYCLPVNPHQEITLRIAPYLKPDSLCVSIAKGLDEAGQTAAQIFSRHLPVHNHYALLYGPMISEEIRAGRNAFAQLGFNNTDSYTQIKQLFQNTKLYLEPSDDITGISWSVILKNVYTLIFGMADELQLGDNMRGYLAVAALQELNCIVRHMGGKAGSPYHLAGLGDLITTATSADSHHHELGRMLARGESENIKGEGIHTLQMTEQHHLFTLSDYPLFQLIHAIVKQPQNVADKINDYLQITFA